MDESNATCGKRLDSIGMENTEASRQVFPSINVGDLAYIHQWSFCRMYMPMHTYLSMLRVALRSYAAMWTVCVRCCMQQVLTQRWHACRHTVSCCARHPAWASTSLEPSSLRRLSTRTPPLAPPWLTSSTSKASCQVPSQLASILGMRSHVSYGLLAHCRCIYCAITTSVRQQHLKAQMLGLQTAG